MPPSVSKFQALIAGMAVALAAGGWAEAPAREYQLKAAFIYNFTQFVEWPADAFPSADAPFIVGVAGADPFDGLLEKFVAAKSVGERRIVVKHFATPDELQPCQLIFVPASGEQWLPRIKQAQGGKPALTVGEDESLLAAGGMMCFFTEDNKLRFQVHQEAVEKAGLKISSKLLKLARIYKR